MFLMQAAFDSSPIRRATSPTSIAASRQVFPPLGPSSKLRETTPSPRGFIGLLRSVEILGSSRSKSIIMVLPMLSRRPPEAPGAFAPRNHDVSTLNQIPCSAYRAIVAVSCDLPKLNICLNSDCRKLLHVAACADKLSVTDTKTIDSCLCNAAKMDKLENWTNCAILDQLENAENMKILDASPTDEVEGELLYLQNCLLDRVTSIKHSCEELIYRITNHLPQELDSFRKKRWDMVLIDQYLCEIKEAKKRGRKERRHTEAQAVLAAATAAAAASRTSVLRKDAIDGISSSQQIGSSDSKWNFVFPLNPRDLIREFYRYKEESSYLVGAALVGRCATRLSCSKGNNQMRVKNPLKNTAARRVTIHSPVPRPKETVSRSFVTKASSDKHSGEFKFPDFAKENALFCDVCWRTETIVNRIFVCSSCKVAVHLDCYRRLKDPTGPWRCELCEDSSFQCTSPKDLQLGHSEKSYSKALCSLCGGSSGAFRKSIDGEWVHAFCAEESISKDKDMNTCCICHNSLGLCLKCSYGHCQSKFHPSCARNAGLFLNIKASGGKLQHKAYCEKHSLEQREKADSQHGSDELRSIKQVRDWITDDKLFSLNMLIANCYNAHDVTVEGKLSDTLRAYLSCWLAPTTKQLNSRGSSGIWPRITSWTEDFLYAECNSGAEMFSLKLSGIQQLRIISVKQVLA
ncbi:hypothetical protein KSP40_PGU005195 [Platanthera guangdongensis]|uniref:Uncharacterized protein n=1 Tax=Platanthera guangdongensis TaxID=2320717 RepID=A0ABR2MZZ5_9ASPA